MLKRFDKGTEYRRLEDFYQDLARLEGKPLRNPLIARWRPPEINAISAEFRAAFMASQFPDHPIQVGDMSPQAVGNAVATRVSTALQQHLDSFAIAPLPGPGYPDFKLTHFDSGKTYPLEMKATGRRVLNNSRVVLTSASSKLRAFAPPVRHLLATVHYLRAGARIRIDSLQLNFLGPHTPVNVRFEVAVTSKILHQDSRVVWF